MPHRRRTANNMASPASSTAASSEYYTQLAQLSSNADPNVAAAYQKYLSQFMATGPAPGAAAFSALAACNPAYTSLLQQYQTVLAQQQAAANQKDSKADSSKSSSESTRKDEDVAEALSSMASIPYMSYNPLMLSQMMAAQSLAANSQYAMLAAMMQQNGAQTPPKSTATSGEEPSPSPASKKQRVRDNSVSHKIRTPSSTVTSAAASVSVPSSSSKHDDIMDLTVKKAAVISSPSVKSIDATAGKSPEKKKSILENIVQDLSSKQVKSQTSTESGEET